MATTINVLSQDGLDKLLELFAAHVGSLDYSPFCVYADTPYAINGQEYIFSHTVIPFQKSGDTRIIKPKQIHAQYLLICDGTPLGKGGYGLVLDNETTWVFQNNQWQLKNRPLDKHRAVKLSSQTDTIKREYTIGHALHPDEFKYVPNEQKQGHNLPFTAVLLSKKYPGITLYDRINNIPNTLLETLMLCERLLAIISQIHKHQIIHEDIKPPNFIISWLLQVRLIDFGLSTTKNQHMAHGGTRGYLAPEITEQNRVASQASDIYSVGVTLSQLIGCFNAAIDYQIQLKANILQYLSLFLVIKPHDRPSATDAHQKFTTWLKDFQRHIELCLNGPKTDSSVLTLEELVYYLTDDKCKARLDWPLVVRSLHQHHDKLMHFHESVLGYLCQMRYRVTDIPTVLKEALAHPAVNARKIRLLLKMGAPLQASHIDAWLESGQNTQDITLWFDILDVLLEKHTNYPQRMYPNNSLAYAYFHFKKNPNLYPFSNAVLARWAKNHLEWSTSYALSYQQIR